MSNKNPTIEDVRDVANQLFYNSHGKRVDYKIIAAELSELADDVYNSVNKVNTVQNKRDTKSKGLVARLVNNNATRQAEQDNSLSL